MITSVLRLQSFAKSIRCSVNSMKDAHFLSYDAQIAHLREKGLMIRDEAYARDVLEAIGYYEPINGYKRLFKDTNNGPFRTGVCFEDILALYKCDENLRQLCFKYILRIEIRMRALLSYAFCERYGEQQQAYLSLSNYDSEGYGAREARRLIGELDYAANRADKAVYVCHYRSRYGNVPLWVLFKTLSLGTLVRFFRCCTPEIRCAVSKTFPGLREDTLGKMLDLMQDFRNVCAHNDRLYSFRSEDSIPRMPAVRALGIPAPDEEYAGNDLFALYCVFCYLLCPGDFSRAKSSTDKILDAFFSQCASVERQTFLDAMGFPQEWSRLAL